ncbi:MAG: hypothetical protein GIW97_03410, partial [Candidatus Eremiobacteraeota bacterium]|nr:hypothetical protein [Candidatus Eremiobacteraeota bacterium]
MPLCIVTRCDLLPSLFHRSLFMFSKTALALALACALLTGVVRAADAPAPGATTTALTALYQEFCMAAMDPTDKNMDTMSALFAP